MVQCLAPGIVNKVDYFRYRVICRYIFYDLYKIFVLTLFNLISHKKKRNYIQLYAHLRCINIQIETVFTTYYFLGVGRIIHLETFASLFRGDQDIVPFLHRYWRLNKNGEMLSYNYPIFSLCK